MKDTRTLVLVVILMLLGMDFITRVHPTIHGSYRWILREMVLRPLRWGLRQLGRQFRRFLQWSGRQVWRFLRFFGRQLHRGSARVWRQSMDRLVLTVLIILALALGLGLALLTVKSVSSLLDSIEWSKVGLITLIVGSVISIAWLIKKFVKREARTAEVYRRSWFRRPAVVIPLILIGIYGPITYLALRSNEERGRSPARSSSLSQLPADVALPIIAGCESGDGTPGSGRQFEADGVTPLRNREGSSAIGKYQIMASLHEERAKGLGYDIRTKEGNEAYARYLYAESDTLHWEADPRSKACWEPKLMALGHSPGLSPSLTTPTTDTTFMVVVRPGQPAEVVMPPDWMIVWWGDKAKFTSHAEWRGKDKVRVFTTRGMGSAEIKVHRYYDPDPNWWRRQ